MNEESKLFLFIAILVTHVIFIFYWVYHFVQEFRETIRKKLPRVYLALFLCCRAKKLQIEQEVEKRRERDQPFIGSIESILECKITRSFSVLYRFQ